MKIFAMKGWRLPKINRSTFELKSFKEKLFSDGCAEGLALLPTDIAEDGVTCAGFARTLRAYPLTFPLVALWYAAPSDKSPAASFSD